MNAQDITEFLRKSINILMVTNPTGTSLGILIGILADGLFTVISPIFVGIKYINLSAIKSYHFICLGVFGVNVPSYLSRNKIDKSIENAINFIEDQKLKGNVTEWQARNMYIKLMEKIVSNIVLDEENESMKQQINKIVISNQKK